MSIHEDHPPNWRIGHSLKQTYMGPATIYCGHPEGDGGKEGRFVAVAFSSELASLIVDAVNLYHRHDGLSGLVTIQAEDPTLWEAPETPRELALSLALLEVHNAIRRVR